MPLCWQPAYVAIGSNLDDPVRQVRAAFEQLAALPDSLLVARSRLWVSPPMGPADQPDYVNAVAGLLTRLEARQLLEALKALEASMGRRAPTHRWGPRIIDFDLIALGNQQRNDPDLSLPHPGVHERDFVLYPLAEIAPALWIPGRGRVERLIRQVRDRGLAPMAQ
jgi:2-amino-4-hydroxy-6-hydroxymethyldihydropteridine diphosphokinase